MARYIRKLVPALTLLVVTLLLAAPAHAFRCKTRLVKDGMHEQEVIAICGEPTSVRQLGYAIRGFSFAHVRRFPGGFARIRQHPGVGYIASEVAVTEFVYNFGPRKLMRRLIFEAGVLVSIETLGYGYIEKDDR